MKHFWIVSLIAACWLCPWQAFSATGRNSAIHFTRISIESGLSQSTIFSITQDRDGNIWFATYDGVNKYDGYGFTVYQHVIGDETSIADDISRTLCTDRTGRIWVGTASGLSLYDEDLDIFRNYYYKDTHQPVNVIHPLSESHLLVALDDRLTVFDIEKRDFRDDILPVTMMPMKAKTISSGDGKIFIGTVSGEVYIYEPEANMVYPLKIFNGGGAAYRQYCSKATVTFT